MNIGIETKFTYTTAIGELVFEYDSAFWVTEIDGISSVDIDVSESRSPGQIGSSITSQSVQPRNFTIDGCIFEPVDSNREKLIDVFAPQVPATLTITSGTQSYFLDVIPTRTPEISLGQGLRNFQVQLRAAYPYWRSTRQYSTQIAGLTALFKFPFYTGGTWWISKYSDNYFRTITNKGNVPIEFNVLFSARSAVVNPELYHMDTRRHILIKKTIMAGEMVLVSTIYGNKGVTITHPDGTTENGFRYLSIDSDLNMALLPGDNLLRMGADQNREGLNIRLQSPEGVRSGV